MDATDKALEGKRLFIVHLSDRLARFESGSAPMRALEYRVLAKTLANALAGYPEPRLRAVFGDNPVVMDAVANQTFAERGSWS